MSVLALMVKRRPVRIVERNALAYRRIWYVFLTGFAEPVLYLLSIGVGVGKLVGDLPGQGGHPVPYQTFVAPGLLASAAMNGAIFDTTFNFFVKFKYMHTYDAMLATPLHTGEVATGEVVWALLRGTIYATGFLVTMLVLGLVEEWSTMFVDSRWKFAIGFGVLLVALLVRPTGLLGRPEVS